MARDPGSVWAPLPEAAAPDGMTKNKFIVHSTGDSKTAAATRAYFAGATLNESTFIVGWGPEDPTLQIMDSSDVADANGAANDEGISVEVVGDGKGGYNAWQRSELIRLGLWVRRTHPQIRPQIIPSAAQESAGFGWHIMFGAPGPWAKGAKICPGPVRIQELKSDIFPAIFAGHDQGDDMAGEGPEILRLLKGADPKMDRLDHLYYDHLTAIRSLSAQVGALTAAVQALATAGGLDAAEMTAAAEAGADAALAALGDRLRPAS